MNEIEKLKERMERLQNIIRINNKNLRKLKPILKSMARQIGYNSSDVKKIIQLFYEFDMDFNESSPPINEDAKGSFI